MRLIVVQCLLLIASVHSASLGRVLGAEIIGYGARWQYLIGTGEASSPDSAAWRRADFKDVNWSSGSAPLGYANPPNSAAEETIATLLPSSQESGYGCVFVRGYFSARSPSAANSFTLNVNVDDGCIVWINGAEVARFNMPDGEVAYNQYAISAIEPTLSSFTFQNSAQGPVVAGTNVVAVQLFNSNPTSSDLFVDLSLQSDLDEASPVIIATEPAAGKNIAEFTSVGVTFSESVTGVGATDLLVNGTPATGVTTISPREYLFSVPPEPLGPIQISFTSQHGIVDLAGNAFAGGAWSYILQDAASDANVVISEFLASNDHGVRDPDGERSDWLEIYNPGPAIANLDGWFVTDSPANLTKWRFPAVVLDSGRYLLVFASGKNRTNITAPLHTNFKLEKSGGYLALVDKRTNVVSLLASYPLQQPDISYGRDANSPELTGYLGTPTPGARNVSSGSGFAPEVVFSQPQGIYTNNSLSIRLSAASGQIRYTTDGSVPLSTSTLYASPISVTASTIIKARAFQNGLLPGPAAAAVYTLVDNSVANFTSNLPLLILSTGGRFIGQDSTPRTLATIVAIDTFRGRSAVKGQPEFVGQGGIEVRGQSSTGFPKPQYNFTFENAYRQQDGMGLFGLPADADWALYAPYTDKPFLQNFLAYELYEQMGHYSVRRKFVEVFLDDGGGKISSADYAGVYILLEKIKIDKNRVDIEQLTPYNAREPEITGGYMFKKDKDSPGDFNFTTIGGSGFSAQTLKLHQPKPADATTQQKNWLRGYIGQLEKALYASNWRTATGTNHWSYYLDADSFVDLHWIVEFSKQIDGYRLSSYFYKPRNGPVHMSPIWDWNLSFGNADYLDGASTANWYWKQISENEHIWLRRLISGTTSTDGTTGDPDFKQKITDRWSELRTNILSSTNVIARARELSTMLSEAANRDFQRWPRLGSYVWPNPPLYANPTTYAGIMQSFTNWVRGRYNWINTQFLPAPTFSLAGGLTQPGSALTLAGTGAGSIYFTVDGSDPRMPGGAVSPKATRYESPISVQSNSKVFARRLNGATWSGPSVRSFSVQRPTLAITEIMYHPATVPAGSSFSESDFEYIELQNFGSSPVELGGVSLSGGIQFTLPAATLPAGAFAVIAKNVAAFQARYGTSANLFGNYTGELDNSEDTLVLTGALGEPLAEVTYKDGWYPSTDGAGFALAARGDNSTDLSDQTSWMQGTAEGGSPGRGELQTMASFPPVVLSELLVRPFAGAAQWIELQNLGPAEVDITGWHLTDDLQQPRRFRIPAGTRIPGGGFVVITSDQFDNAASALDPFTLNPTGEEVHLFAADSAGKLSGYIDGLEFGPQREGVSIGSSIDSTGHKTFVSLTGITPGQSNASPVQPAVVISEVMYHPSDVFLNNQFWNNTEDEFVEIANRSGQAVSLFDGIRSTNGWRLQGGIEFAFQTNAILEASAVALIVSFDPARDPQQAAAFRASFSVPAGAVIFGPFKGSLNNSGDRVALVSPDIPLVTGEVPFAVVDEVTYGDQSAWNSGADGLGFSLTRIDLNGYGTDPVKWAATAPSPGSIETSGSAPTITIQPKTQFATVGGTISLNIAASSPGNLNYQWLFKGSPIPGATREILTLTNLNLTNNGFYTVVVFTAASATTSERAYLSVSIDSDGDGMPDQWEFSLGLNPFNATDATGDADLDGFSNRDEYLAGTNPQARESYLNVAPASNPDAAPGVRFFAAPQRSYTVLYSDSLTAPNWNKLADIPAASSGTEVIVADSNAAARRFYRIVTPAL